MKIITIPCLKTNYAYLIACEETGHCAVVDPAKAKPILKALDQHPFQLVAIFNTHHHRDHVGGNGKLLRHFPHLRIYGHHSDRGRIKGQNVFLRDRDSVAVGCLKGYVTHNPGHTRGGLSYYFQNAVFTGDTLFGSGCGRLFEGSATEMAISLTQTIGSHPATTAVYFGHEYTETNLRFAHMVEPDNAAVIEKLARVRDLRARGGFTTPSTLAEEWATNPFMRLSAPQILETVQRLRPDGDLQPASVLATLRHLKDRFK